MQTGTRNLERVVTVIVLTMTLSMIWGAVLTLVIALAARGLGV
ncbi:MULTISPECIES: hypothetical protein [Bradyrhizobium]|uniref:Uncharacterized protein n=1 Tax=Bradyrhizobium vignae TaxID=1549949 RepID=A0A2U3PWM0_9BRAD|nr:hypothetical protein [Bradyrhizobium vignae]SPP93543.1 conserved protein of unknown function [Bradyrhizobium vignae]